MIVKSNNDNTCKDENTTQNNRTTMNIIITGVLIDSASISFLPQLMVLLRLGCSVMVQHRAFFLPFAPP